MFINFLTCSQPNMTTIPIRASTRHKIGLVNTKPTVARAMIPSPTCRFVIFKTNSNKKPPLKRDGHSYFLRKPVHPFFVWFTQPQNGLPSNFPLEAMRVTIVKPHFGHLGAFPLVLTLLKTKTANAIPRPAITRNGCPARKPAMSSSILRRRADRLA